MPPVGRTRLTHAERRATILDAAARVIVDRGVQGFRLQDVADAAGVSQPLVSSHVSSRDELVAEAFVRADERELQDVEDDVSAAAPGRDAVVLFLRRATIPDQQSNSDGRELWSQVTSRSRFSPVVREAVRARQGAWVAALAATLRAGRGRDVPDGLDVDAVATLLITISDGLGPALNGGLVDADAATRVLDDALDAVLR
ncbi:TetR/AcrR family transcriptional regulator [Patulibacter americanus]|uniref:TetR/AcrR family transcriptional regulator n=1 Tax=Patulibacter americanus TaxID=588672 RepID=UPI0003B70AE8|nr:TetR/AcrR family transcriptional regulator [Patulibacter americanus]